MTLHSPDHEYDCTGDAAAYVLGALDEHEVRPFLRHLEMCSICRDEVASLQLVADMLPTAVPPATPPRGLRRRVLATVYEEAEALEAARRPAAASPPDRGLFAGWRRRRGSRSAGAGSGAGSRAVPRPFQALAGAALVAAGIGVGAVVIDGPGSPRTRLVVARVTQPATSAVLRLTGDRTELDVAHLAAPANGRVYEVWLERSGRFEPTDALFTPTSSGSATVAVPGDLNGVKAVLVTDEPPGGSLAPTTAPLITAALS